MKWCISGSCTRVATFIDPSQLAELVDGRHLANSRYQNQMSGRALFTFILAVGEELKVTELTCETQVTCHLCVGYHVGSIEVKAVAVILIPYAAFPPNRSACTTAPGMLLPRGDQPSMNVTYCRTECRSYSSACLCLVFLENTRSINRFV